MEESVSFFSLLVDKLLTLHKAKDKAVRLVAQCPCTLFNGDGVSRFRVCQLLAKVFGHAADTNVLVGSKCMDKFQQAMLLRLHDKVKSPS